jgi:hypothetical protein
MQIIRNLISRVTAAWTLYGYVTQFNAAVKSFPGTGDEIRLRAWLLDHLALITGWVAKTDSPVDDDIVYYMLRIIENDTAWKILFGMISLTGVFRQGTSGSQTVPQLEKEPAGEIASDALCCAEKEQCDCILALYEIDKSLQIGTVVGQEPKFKNPMLIISAVGLILQIIQYLRSR